MRRQLGIGGACKGAVQNTRHLFFEIVCTGPATRARSDSPDFAPSSLAMLATTMPPGCRRAIASGEQRARFVALPRRQHEHQRIAAIVVRGDI